MSKLTNDERRYGLMTCPFMVIYIRSNYVRYKQNLRRFFTLKVLEFLKLITVAVVDTVTQLRLYFRLRLQAN